jgi:hypothetical protein
VSRWQQTARFALEFTRDGVGLFLGSYFLLRETVDPAATSAHFYAILGVGFSLVAPGIAAHVRALLPSSDAASSWESAEDRGAPPSSPSSSTSPEAPGE